MRTPASIAGHPIHPMLVPIAIGLWIFSPVGDLIHAGGNANPAWTTVAFYCMGGGIVGALLAAVPGLIVVESSDEDGTVFSARLPRAPAKAAGSEARG